MTLDAVDAALYSNGVIVGDVLLRRPGHGVVVLGHGDGHASNTNNTYTAAAERGTATGMHALARPCRTERLRPATRVVVGTSDMPFAILAWHMLVDLEAQPP